MSDKLKERARALAKKLDISYQAAVNQLQVANNEAVASLLAQLHASSAFVVSVGRLPAIGASASATVASAQAAALAANPVISAESGAVSMIVTPQQGHALIQCGAADTRKVQMIRSFHNMDRITFSTHCASCMRWIWCGFEEVEDSCFCGQRYRVAFDLAPVYHWTLPQNRRCMECGIEAVMHPVASEISPWRLVNVGQSRCNQCHVKQAG